MKNNRKIILINPAFQMRFIMATLILLIFSIASIYVALQYYFIELIDIGISKNLYHDNVYFNILSTQQQSISNFVLVIAVVLLFGTGAWALYFSHRIAGPMYKLKKTFSEASMNEGQKIYPLKFRKDDFFHDVTDHINLYLDKNHLLQKKED